MAPNREELARSRKTWQLGAIREKSLLGLRTYLAVAIFIRRDPSPDDRAAQESSMDILFATLMGASFVAAIASLLKAPVTVIARRRRDELRIEYR